MIDKIGDQKNMNKIYLTNDELYCIYRTLQLEELDLDSQIIMQKELLKEVTSIDYNGYTEPCSIQDNIDRLLNDKVILSEIIAKINEHM